MGNKIYIAVVHGETAHNRIVPRASHTLPTYFTLLYRFFPSFCFEKCYLCFIHSFHIMDHEFKMVVLTLPFQNLKQLSENLSDPPLTLQSIPFSEY